MIRWAPVGSFAVTDDLSVPDTLTLHGPGVHWALSRAHGDPVAMQGLRRLLAEITFLSVHRMSDAHVVAEIASRLDARSLRLLTQEQMEVVLQESRRIGALYTPGSKQGATPATPLPAARKPAREKEPTQEIDLKYTRADGSGVAGAKYHIRSDTYNNDGALDGNGQIHLSGVPMTVSTFSFTFDSDPKPFAPTVQPKTPSTLASVRDGALSALDAAGSWLWGTVQGDFNENQSTSQLVVNTILGVIPIVDQVLDVRDLIAGSTSLIGHYARDPGEKDPPPVLGLSHESWLWLNLFLIALGAIPIFGSVVKGVLKGLIKKLKSLGGVAGSLSPAQLRALWEELVAILNHFGAGNAHRWLKEAPGKLGGWMDQAAAKIRAAFDTLGKKLEQTRAIALRIGGDTARDAAESIAKAQRGLAKAYSRLDAMKVELNAWLGEQLSKVVSGKHSFDGSSSPGAVGTRTQQATPPPDLDPVPGPRPLTAAARRKILDEMNDIARKGDVSTPKDGLHLWSGGDSQNAARKAAADAKGKILEDTPAGRRLEELQKQLPEYKSLPLDEQAETKSAWKTASERLCKQASGAVDVVVDPTKVKPTSVVWNELKMLRDNAKVTNVRVVDNTGNVLSDGTAADAMAALEKATGQ